MQKVSFTVDGQNLVGVLFFPENIQEKNPAILLAQGWTGEKKRSYQYAHALSALGYICMLYDARGHGESEGDINTATISDFLDDMLAAYDILSEIDGVDKENISAVGTSFGSYLIMLLSEKRSLKNIALRAPADYRNEDFDISKMKASGSDNPVVVDWRKQKKDPNSTFALRALSNFAGEVLIIESGNDTIVPHETIENYLNSVKEKSHLTHIVVKDAPHSIGDGEFRDEITKILVEWFKDKI